MPESSVGYLEGAAGVRVAYRAWQLPDPAGCLLFVHGLGEHGGRYDRLARVAADAELDTFAIDLRGHGRTRGRRGHVTRFAQFLQDLEHLRRRAVERSRAGRTLLVGHSLGGLVAGRYAQALAPDGLRGVAFVAPFVDVAMPLPGWKRTLGRVTDRLAPGLTLDNGLDVNELFRRQEERDRYSDDPLVHRRISARLWGEMQRAAGRLMDDAGGLRVPVLLQLAGRDAVVSNAASRRFGKRLPIRPETIEYEDAYHALYFDPVAGTALADLAAWMKERLADGTMDE